MGQSDQDGIWGPRLLSYEAENTYGVTLWTCIKTWWPSIKRHSVIKVHNGNKALSWKEKWWVVGVCKTYFLIYFFWPNTK